MSSPVWFALPPEVHSSLLSSGAGPGPLFAAAGAWRMLAAEYDAVATELTGLLTTVECAAWQGSSAEQYVGAHQPFLHWLQEAGTVASVAATSHETAATGYISALSSMPTLTELAANHAAHGVLTATNFFGINTIPITLNEADYSRMWIQAATTMTEYQASSEASLMSTMQTSAAPQIQSSGGGLFDSAGFPDPTNLIIQLLKELLMSLRNMAAQNATGPWGRFVVQALDLIIAFMGSQWFLIPAYSVLDPLIYFGPFLPLLLALIAPIGLVGLAFLAAPKAPQVQVEELHPAVPDRPGLPATVGTAPAGTSPTPSPAATANAPTTSTAGAPSTPAPAAAPTLYLIGGDPGGEGFSPTSTTKTAADSTAWLAAPASANQEARNQAELKRRVRARQHGRKYQFAYLDEGAAASTGPPEVANFTVSESGIGTIGFAGTLSKSTAAQAQGLTHLRPDQFGEASKEPMLPATWTGDEPGAPS